MWKKRVNSAPQFLTSWRNWMVWWHPATVRRDRLETRPLAGLETDGLTERMGDDENVAEQDRRVEAETPDRLQGRLERRDRASRRSRGRSPPWRKPCAIFGEIAPGLAHQPDRRRGLGDAGQRREKSPSWLAPNHHARPSRTQARACGLPLFSVRRQRAARRSKIALGPAALAP